MQTMTGLRPSGQHPHATSGPPSAGSRKASSRAFRPRYHLIFHGIYWQRFQQNNSTEPIGAGDAGGTQAPGMDRRPSGKQADGLDANAGGQIFPPTSAVRLRAAAAACATSRHCLASLSRIVNHLYGHGGRPSMAIARYDLADLARASTSARSRAVISMHRLQAARTPSGCAETLGVYTLLRMNSQFPEAP